MTNFGAWEQRLYDVMGRLRRSCATGDQAGAIAATLKIEAESARVVSHAPPPQGDK